MKVKLENDYRRFYTLEDLDRAKTVIALMKEDDSTATDYAAQAARHIALHNDDCLDRILEASAHTALHRGIVWDRLGDATGLMDVWIDFIAKTSCGFIIGGAYLTDIWDIDGVNDITGLMYKEIYRHA